MSTQSEYRVTYLLGAGASCQVLPLVHQIPARLQVFRDDLVNWSTEDTVKSEERHVLVRNLEWLIKEAARHASVDTLAKKLFVTKQNELLHQVKLLLSCFFIFEQLRQSPDKRYDPFFAALIDAQNGSLPGNVRILSWNYDLQLEKAFSEYSMETSMSENQRRLNVHPRPGLGKVPLDAPGVNDTAAFAVFKLNGTTDFLSFDYRDGELMSEFRFLTIDSDALIERLLDFYLRLRTTTKFNQPALTFAWEASDLTRTTMETAMKSTADTQCLVVIGYSFPVFNRDVDRRLIRNMKSLSRVYLQAPPEAAETNATRFRSIRSEMGRAVELVTDVDQFFIPPEL